ncbi:MAG: sugar phosphate nucleotidyltransferase [Nitrospira sp.]|nr:sugar phosphate nucleotidyltransferase [Nitrospira sp.]MDH4305409.1 sugar phosphate nucleotidyltransferase [Nitrospira sp.]MDH5194138.1 sugar phosphate nucleotidyltransferase [Nitrospira sp.]
MTTPCTTRWNVQVDEQAVIPDLWSIVLAGGEGTRLAPMIKQWLGEDRPKQYCTFTGTRSMLQHTVDRADQLAAASRRVTVVADDQRATAWSQLDGRGGLLVGQPANRDTAAGVFLPLTYVRAADPSATVAIYPSDHFVHPEAQLIDAVRHAVLASDLLEDRLILIGIRPDCVDLDYGYIQPGRYVGGYGAHSLWDVGRFVEKPEQRLARTFMGEDMLWNTMIVVAKVETLWQLGMKVLPSVMRLLETLLPAIGTTREEQVLQSIYHSMPRRNFSMDFLEHVSPKILALEVKDILWSDWGRPKRIVQSLDRIGKVPMFPAEAVGVA